MQFFLNSSRFADTFAAAAAPGGGGSSLPTAPTAPGAAALLPAGDGRAATTGSPPALLARAVVLLLAVAGLSGSAAAAPASCKKVVYCLNGQAQLNDDFTSPTNRTCAVECDGNCCLNYGCNWNESRFAVCADDGDGSCDGYAACAYAGGNGTIGLISGGSCVGSRACEEAAKDGGTIGDISDGSCADSRACYEAAKDGGAVGDISGGSCAGYLACYEAAYYGGAVGDIAGSCQASSACYNLGRQNGQFQESPNACCNSASECQYFGCLNSTDCGADAPSNLPATCLTVSPTGSPIGSPTVSPTGSPTGSERSPWDIDFLDVITNFTVSSVEEIEVKYVIGKNRNYKTSLYQSDCSSSIGDVDILSTNTTSNISNNNTHQNLVVKHDIKNITQLSESTEIWNSSSNTLQICQVIELYEGGKNNAGDLMVTHDKRVLDIDFNLTVAYSTGDINITEISLKAGDDTANVNDYIMAYKCNGADFRESVGVFQENTKLNICLKSVEDGVEINELQSMTITQNAGSQKITLQIIEDSLPVYPSLTSKTTVLDKNGIFVATRVPYSTISYSGNPIIISGTVDLQFAETTGRKLRFNIDTMHNGAVNDRDLQARNMQAASFDLQINLESQMAAKKSATMNTATITGTSNAFALVAMLLVSAYTLG